MSGSVTGANVAVICTCPEEELGFRRHREVSLVQNDPANGLPYRRPPRFPGHGVGKPQFPEPLVQEACLGALSGTLDTLQDDEQALGQEAPSS